MFVALRSAVHADIDRQIGWAKDQVKRQTRHTALTGILAGVAGLPHSVLLSSVSSLFIPGLQCKPVRSSHTA
jgi:hypothetical protein